MQPEIIHGLWLRVDTMSGTWWVPEDLVGPVFLKQDVAYEVDWYNLEEDSKLRALVDDLEDYVEADRTEIYELTLVEGWGGRMRAPGYTDRTEWVVLPDREDVEAVLEDMYGDSDD
jgi:hypothetical protein